MYLKRKTRRTWNGDHSASVFAVKKWMVLGPDFFPGRQFLGEGGELVDTAELRRRFENTFEFLRNNNRPYWAVVVAEHKRFVDAVREEKE